MSTAGVVKAYIDYQKANAQIKARQRAERARELEPFLADIGSAVVDARSTGETLSTLSDAISNKNRNFLYGALRALARRGGELPDEVEIEAQRGADEPAEQVPAPAAPAEPSEWVEPPYEVQSETSPDTSYVYIGGVETELVLEDGFVVDMPQQWLRATGAEKAFYRRLIKEVEDAAAAQ